MCRFENFLWQHFNPAEVLEEWADLATEAVMRFALAFDVNPDEVPLPPSSEVMNYVRYAHEFFRTPLSERDPGEVLLDVYPGEALTEDELRWVARHIQASIIPAC